jgi:1-deoxy-D-xylulose 5-phosphate reductoisomerase
VAAGAVFRDAIEKSGAQVLPVDSEHNAIFQVLGSGDASEADLVTITASGGPFREWTLERMRAATVEEAIAHPNWAMGRKISLDSATLMNKGLELIEAHFLFALPPEKLGVVVHPQSIVHCLVSYEDGTTMAHLSAPDMRTPIAHALGWPRRIPSPSRRLDLAKLGSLVFQEPAHDRSRRSIWRLTRCVRGGWRRPCSMPPMKSRSRPSWTTVSGFSTFPVWLPPPWIRMSAAMAWRGICKACWVPTPGRAFWQRKFARE